MTKEEIIKAVNSFRGANREFSQEMGPIIDSIIGLIDGESSNAEDVEYVIARALNDLNARLEALEKPHVLTVLNITNDVQGQTVSLDTGLTYLSLDGKQPTMSDLANIDIRNTIVTGTESTGSGDFAITQYSAGGGLIGIYAGFYNDGMGYTFTISLDEHSDYATILYQES